jgi:hypothetical protein
MVRSLSLMAVRSLTLAHSALGPPLKLHGAHVRIAEVETGIDSSEGNKRAIVEHIETGAGIRKSVRTSRRLGERGIRSRPQPPSGPILLVSSN